MPGQLSTLCSTPGSEWGKFTYIKSLFKGQVAPLTESHINGSILIDRTTETMDVALKQ